MGRRGKAAPAPKGHPLGRLSALEQQHLLLLVPEICDFLHQKGLADPVLFIVNSQNGDVSAAVGKLMAVLDERGEASKMELRNAFSTFPPVVWASVIKAWMKHAEVPFFASEVTKALISVFTNEHFTETHRVKVARSVLDAVPCHRRRVLGALCSLLRDLAVVRLDQSAHQIAPLLMATTRMSDLVNARYAVDVVKLLSSSADEIFGQHSPGPPSPQGRAPLTLHHQPQRQIPAAASGGTSVSSSAPPPQRLARPPPPSGASRRQKTMAKATFDFSAGTAQEMTLREGEVVEVLDRSGTDGWWRGRKPDGTEGLFPKDYVEIEEPSSAPSMSDRAASGAARLSGRRRAGLKHTSIKRSATPPPPSAGSLPPKPKAIPKPMLAETRSKAAPSFSFKPPSKPPPTPVVSSGRGGGRGGGGGGGGFLAEIRKGKELSRLKHVSESRPKPSDPRRSFGAKAKAGVGRIGGGGVAAGFGGIRAPPPSKAPRPQPPALRSRPETVRAIYDYSAGSSDELSLVEGDMLTVLSKDEEEGWWRGRKQNGDEGVFPNNYVE